MLFVDKKSIGFFSKTDLYNLLANYSFQLDKQKELLQSFMELDQDADGYIPKDEIKNILMSLGEPLDEREMDYLLQLV